MRLSEVATQSMTYGGAGTAVAAGLTLSKLGVIVGIIVGLTGLCLQGWATIRRDARETQAHRIQMARMRVLKEISHGDSKEPKRRGGGEV